MYVKSVVPNTFATDELLDPNKVNDNNYYVRDAINFVASNRYVRSVVVLPFYLGVTGITNASSQATRSYLIPAMDDMVIERMFLNGALASGSASVNVYNASTGTTAPTGVSNPVFSVSTTVSEQAYTQPIALAANAVYRIEITGAAFTTAKLDLVLHLRTDKLNPAGSDLTPAPQFTVFEEVDSLDATEFTAAVTALTSVVTTLQNNTRACRVQCAVFTNFQTATDADTLRQDLPRATNTVASETIYRMFSHVSLDTNGAAFQNITCSVTTAAGASIGVSNINSVSGLTEASATDTTSVDIASATTGIVSDNTADYRITALNSAATVCTKASVWLFTI